MRSLYYFQNSPVSSMLQPVPYLVMFHDDVFVGARGISV